MSLLGNFENGPRRPLGWNPDRSNDRFAYRIYSVRPDTRGLRAGLWLAAAAGVILLGILISNKLNATAPASRWLVEAAGQITPPVAPPTPTAEIATVPASESWGVVALTEAQIYASPESKGAPVQRLSRLTLLAFEKKSSNGWYMLFGGSGWVNIAQVKTYPSEQSAREAITQATNQASSTPAAPKA
jgi:hypothetical protein